jgi:ribosomal-protein-alanine N-acetyltransferase
MEMMPFNNVVATPSQPMIVADTTLHTASAEWQAFVPLLMNRTTRLRELQVSDAPYLLALLATEEVKRFISPPPTTVEAFEQFIRWAHRKRAEGSYVCFGIVPAGFDHAVGIFQIQCKPGQIPEWGFAMGSNFWGTGLFVEGAEAVLDFAFGEMGLNTVGARAATENLRGNGALQKLGAVRRGVINEGLILGERTYDQYYWTISADARPRKKIVWDPSTH